MEVAWTSETLYGVTI